MTTTPTPGGSIFTRCQGVNIQAVLTNAAAVEFQAWLEDPGHSWVCLDLEPERGSRVSRNWAVSNSPEILPPRILGPLTSTDLMAAPGVRSTLSRSTQNTAGLMVDSDRPHLPPRRPGPRRIPAACSRRWCRRGEDNLRIARLSRRRLAGGRWQLAVVDRSRRAGHCGGDRLPGRGSRRGPREVSRRAGVAGLRGRS